ncbi:hypothetical protein W909_07160 [Dickeya zeae EC1]|nr:hypothetical protein W909_07160 [Dickeya zeae EC1]
MNVLLITTNLITTQRIHFSRCRAAATAATINAG